jgi:hypothetical protein
MKQLAWLIMGLLGSLGSKAQDIIVLRSGNEIQVQLADTGFGLIRYKRMDNPSGPLYSLPRNEVSRIIYRDGRSDIISVSALISPTTVESKLRYGGPRIGVTYLGSGETNNRMNDIFDRNINPFITQFGWQFETRFFTLDNGASGLIEFVPMIGGLEQGLFIPSITALVGYRSKKGYELGMGPTLSLGGVGVLFAAGSSLKSGKIVFPINLAFIPSITKSYPEETTEETVYNPSTGSYVTIVKTKPAYKEYTGFRLTLTLGFNSRSK